ncbi:hypothetical protein Q2941_00055 [Bradyrhizobium sp. UFLA05-153]
MAITRQRSGLRILAGCAVLSLVCTIQSASAHEARKRIADANALAPRNAPAPSKAGQAKGPYYVDFRARTAASWGHAFVWYGKTSERAVEVAGLTPAGDTLTYMLGHVIPVPSETGASYGDLDPEYLTASYRVYLNEADAKRVFAYIRKLQDSSPVWNAETMNCTGFIGNIAEFMGLKVPMRWQRPEEYVSKLKEMNAGRQMVRLAPEQ